jgi:hypothetical protein
MFNEFDIGVKQQLKLLYARGGSDSGKNPEAATKLK